MNRTAMALALSLLVLLSVLALVMVFIPPGLLQTLLVLIMGGAAVFLGNRTRKPEQEPKTKLETPVEPIDVPSARSEDLPADLPEANELPDFSELERFVEQIREELAGSHAEMTTRYQSSNEYVASIVSDAGLLQQNADQAYAISDNVAGTAGKAFELSDNMQSKVSSLAEEMKLSLEETSVLSQESQKISGILEMMNQIAASTHVLSINASIVAARAGSHGKAFDVVAKEIRTLAQNTASSLASIEHIIKDIQSRIDQVAARTKKSSETIMSEKDSMMSVAGALQGVILAVEVIRTVSSMSSSKAAQLKIEAGNMSRQGESAKLDHCKEGLEATISKLAMEIKRLKEL